jgi:phosphotransferase system HPr (HPr) family protein
MIEKEITVNLEQGLQARSATKFVQKASFYNCEIHIIKNRTSVAGKSIMGVMSLAVSKGEKLTLIVDGNDELEAVRTLEDFLSSKQLLNEERN